MTDAVIITRPQGQHNYLATALEQRGLEVRYLPLMQIEAVQTTAELELLKQQTLNVDQYQVVVVVSMNAAEHGLAWLDKYWPQFPVSIDWVAVGPSTTEILTKAGLRVHCPAQSYDTEGMLQLACLQPSQLADKKVLLWRGVGGRETLANALRAAGAKVDYAEFYQRLAVQHSPAAWQQAVLGQPALMLSSTQQIEILLAQAAGITQQVSMVITPTERSAKKAREAGFERVFAAASARDDDMIAALIKHQE